MEDTVGRSMGLDVIRKDPAWSCGLEPHPVGIEVSRENPSRYSSGDP